MNISVKGEYALHAIFDLAAWLAAFAAIWWLSRIRGLKFPSQSFELPYIAVSLDRHDIFETADRITVLRLGRNVGVYEREKTTE